MNKIFLITIVAIFPLSLSWASSFECSTVASTKRIGLSCKTTRGHEFKRVFKYNQLGWQDLASGLIWYDAYAFRVTHEEAGQYCANLNLRLPDEIEFDSGLNREVQEPVEVFRTNIGYRTTYWAATVKEDNPKFAVVYYETGKKDYSVRSNKTAYTRAVCVGN